MARGLHDETIAAAHVLVELDEDFAIVEESCVTLAQREIQVGAHRAGQRTSGAPGKDLQALAVGSTHGRVSTAAVVGEAPRVIRVERIDSTVPSCCGVLTLRTSSGETAETTSTGAPALRSTSKTSVR